MWLHIPRSYFCASEATWHYSLKIMITITNFYGVLTMFLALSWGVTCISFNPYPNPRFSIIILILHAKKTKAQSGEVNSHATLSLHNELVTRFGHGSILLLLLMAYIQSASKNILQKLISSGMSSQLVWASSEWTLRESKQIGIVDSDACRGQTVNISEWRQPTVTH